MSPNGCGRAGGQCTDCNSLTLEEVAIRFDGHDDGAVTQANGSFHSREDQKVELEHDETVPNNLPKSAA